MQPIVDRQHPFSYIVWGFVLHSVGRVFLSITQMQIVYSLICLLGWYLILRGFYLMKEDLHMQISGKQALWIKFYMLLCIVMIVRGYMIDYPFLWISTNGFINYHFFNPTYILPYLMPLVLWIPIKEYDFRPLVRASVFLSIVVIICFALYYKQIIASSIKQSLGTLQSSDQAAEDFRFYGQLYVNVAIIALCRKFVSFKVWGINTLALLLTLLINVFAARRGTSLTLAAILLFDLYFFIKSLPRRYRFAGFLTIGVLSAAAVAMTFNFSGFDYIKHRGMQDSRSHIDKALMEQMDDTQKLFGKGLNGRYYFNLHIANDYLGGWRYVSETGYYNLVLKGGYILTWVYILMFLYPAWLGLFKSRNLLCKALGFLIFLSLLELYPFGVLTFNLKFLVLWMGVALNSNTYIRSLDDKEIYEKYFALGQ